MLRRTRSSVLTAGSRASWPDVNDDPHTQERFKDVAAAYEVLSDPDKRQMFDMGADPRAPRGGGGGAGQNPGAGFGFDFGDIMDAFFGGQQRGPRSRRRRGQDALVRVEVSLSDAVFGAERELQLETAVECPTCEGTCCAPGTTPVTCDICKGRGSVQVMQRSLLGQVMTARQCSQCQGYGETLPHPCCASGPYSSTLSSKIPVGPPFFARNRLNHANRTSGYLCC